MAGFKLPEMVTGKVDVSRLIRELETLDEFLMQAAIRQPGTSMHLPRTSRLLEEMARLNSINLLQQPDRQHLLKELETVRSDAPEIHISFSSDPSAPFVQKIVSWFRKEVHPAIMIQIGLQPNIAAGCVIRTTNRYLDLSLRRHISSKKAQLIQRIGEGRER